VDTLLGIDWREAWLEREKKRNKAAQSSCWDERSQDFKEHSGVSAYTDIFLQYLDLEPGQSVLDMGSGPGTVAIPLALRGHRVVAADFSPGMREVALQRAHEQGLKDFEVKALDWNEDWQVAGIKPKSFDVVIASRSTMVDDLGAAFEKLDLTARSKVALTMVTEYGPKGYKPLGSEQDGCAEYLPDYIYGVNLLLQMGIHPELRYIETTHGNCPDMEGKLVRWAYLSWEPMTL